MKNIRLNKLKYSKILSKIKKSNIKRLIWILNDELKRKQSINGFRMLGELYEIQCKFDKAIEAYLAALAIAKEHEDDEQCRDLTILLSFHDVEISEIDEFRITVPIEREFNLPPKMVSFPVVRDIEFVR